MCAIFGVIGHEEAAHLTYLGLHALQHRGQEGAGIVSTDGKDSHFKKHRGLVGDIFHSGNLAKLTGKAAIGHTRYSTAGGDTDANLQPVLMTSRHGWVAVAHNGNLTNAKQLTQKLESEGSIFQSTSDTETIVHLMARSRHNDIQLALVEALEQVQGAYSLLVLTKDELIAVRDPMGFRPLVLGDLNGLPVFASETCAFDLIGAKYVREVERGELIRVKLANPKHIEISRPLSAAPPKRCVFEHVYLARPDSKVYGSNVYEVRKALGRRLAKEQPALTADIVVPVPDSGVPAAVGFAEASGLPFDIGIIRSHYVGRTFIEPKQSIRDFGVKLKLNPIRAVVSGKSIVIVDDSLVRGTTSKKLVQHLRNAGATQVHMRISAPPTTNPCYYGIDTPTRKELVASSHTVEQIREFIGADSLGYLSVEGLMEVSSDGDSTKTTSFCHACFSGQYPIPPAG